MRKHLRIESRGMTTAGRAAFGVSVKFRRFAQYSRCQLGCYGKHLARYVLGYLLSFARCGDDILVSKTDTRNGLLMNSRNQWNSESAFAGAT